MDKKKVTCEEIVGILDSWDFGEIRVFLHPGYETSNGIAIQLYGIQKMPIEIQMRQMIPILRKAIKAILGKEPEALRFDTWLDDWTLLIQYAEIL